MLPGSWEIKTWASCQDHRHLPQHPFQTASFPAGLCFSSSSPEMLSQESGQLWNPLPAPSFINSSLSPCPGFSIWRSLCFGPQPRLSLPQEGSLPLISPPTSARVSFLKWGWVSPTALLYRCPSPPAPSHKRRPSF